MKIFLKRLGWQIKVSFDNSEVLPGIGKNTIQPLYIGRDQINCQFNPNNKHVTVQIKDNSTFATYETGDISAGDQLYIDTGSGGGYVAVVSEATFDAAYPALFPLPNGGGAPGTTPAWNDTLAQNERASIAPVLTDVAMIWETAGSANDVEVYYNDPGAPARTSPDIYYWPIKNGNPDVIAMISDFDNENLQVVTSRGNSTDQGIIINDNSLEVNDNNGLGTVAAYVRDTAAAPSYVAVFPSKLVFSDLAQNGTVCEIKNISTFNEDFRLPVKNSAAGGGDTFAMVSDLPLTFAYNFPITNEINVLTGNVVNKRTNCSFFLNYGFNVNNSRLEIYSQFDVLPVAANTITSFEMDLSGLSLPGGGTQDVYTGNVVAYDNVFGTTIIVGYVTIGTSADKAKVTFRCSSAVSYSVSVSIQVNF